MSIHVTVNSDGKGFIRAWNSFLWKIRKAEAYFIQLNHIVVKQIISEKELLLLVLECILEFKKDHTFQLF